MELSEILKPDAVKVVGTFSSKKRLLQELSDVAAACYGIDAGHAVNALLERENLGPTGVGHGVALPHARIRGISRVIGIFFRVEKGVNFNAVDRQPVDLAFGLFAPEDAGVEHLKALALVSRTMRDSGVCGKLRANDNPLTLHAILTEAPASKAA
ncbi:PTS sugar transporter subunit IIA [Roseitranquillus sediminis]|uniref:PTS sugar transporter subunit IIA n=1 Tax=Roseitranquillus sediminis TaxID=2809051 RepID=UPI001D0C6778|nr:PTS sugar transporter subunit IIA [Roseitranquillus sediminis]MBM9593779.1 PTS sugar transporter subunit IIA [Roseitranquillus sediminis]